MRLRNRTQREAPRQAIGAALPCAIDTSIWRSIVTICSALNLFFGMSKLLSKLFSHIAWFKKARSGQLVQAHLNIDLSFLDRLPKDKLPII
jgi:hypothetical protein